MKDFHYELPRIFDRIPFVSLGTATAVGHQELTIGYGKYSLNIGKWYIFLEGV